MADNFDDYQSGLTSPALHAVAVTPHDSTDLTAFARSLYVGAAGNISLVTAGGDTALFTGVLAGSILPVRVQRVNATSTTATSIVSLY